LTTPVAPAQQSRMAGRNQQNAPPARPYPFPVGVYESGVQDYDNTVTLGATPTLAPLWNISPTGWARGLWFDFLFTSTAGTVTAALADAPFSGVQKCTLYDLGGEVVFQVTGYEWMVINKFGGYFEIADPRADLTYSTVTGAGGTTHFMLYLPFEIVARDAFGTVQNESKPGWKVELYLDANGIAQPASTAGNCRVRGFVDSYTEPASTAPNGRPFAQTPPLPGSLQYWKSENVSLPASTVKYDLTNAVGFPIRNIIYYVRDAGNGTRATADPNWMDPATLLIGNINYFTRSKNLWIAKLSKTFGFASVGASVPAVDTAQGRENGVFPVWFTQDMHLMPGAELRFKYLDTQVNSLIRLTGSMGGATTFFALTNWVATPSKNRYALISGGAG
jgi:hypothetical protein